MGVSRSGRVRKKSSKLIDFESPEEAEIRPKKSGNKRYWHFYRLIVSDSDIYLLSSYTKSFSVQNQIS